MNKVLFLLLSLFVFKGSVNAMEHFPFHEAAKEGNLPLVTALLNAGVNINLQDGLGRTPLHYAVVWNHEAVVAFLLDRGANADLHDKTYGERPMHLAVMNGHTALVKLLLDKGVNANLVDCYGMAPLHWAAFCGNTAIIRFFLANGIDINLRDRDNRTPLHLAVYGDYQGAKYHLVGDADYKAAVKLLLCRGADVNLRDKLGKTPMQIATGAIADLLSSWSAVVSGSKAGRLAFCMAMHPRVGINSLANVFPREIFQEICRYLVPSLLIDDPETVAKYRHIYE